MSFVGIFWVWEEKVFAFPVALGDATRTGDHLDSPGTHDQLWEQVKRQAPQLRHDEYFSLPRGRVVYDTAQDRFTVFLDNVLMKPEIKRKLREAFQLPVRKTLFERDSHYTTDPKQLESIFEVPESES